MKYVKLFFSYRARQFEKHGFEKNAFKVFSSKNGDRTWRDKKIHDFHNFSNSGLKFYMRISECICNRIKKNIDFLTHLQEKLPLIYKFLLSHRFLEFSHIFSPRMPGFPGQGNIYFALALNPLTSISIVWVRQSVFFQFFPLSLRTHKCGLVSLALFYITCRSFRGNLCMFFCNVSASHSCPHFLYFLFKFFPHNIHGMEVSKVAATISLTAVKFGKLMFFQPSVKKKFWISQVSLLVHCFKYIL